MPHLIDLTHPITDGMAVYPGDPVPVIEPHDTIRSTGYNTTLLSLGNHTGTHLDVPYHFLEDGARVDEVALERFHGPAELIDLGSNTVIDVAALEPHAEAFQPGAKVVYRTGWGSRFGGDSFYHGYPSLTAGAARWIADHGIGLLGLDTPSPSEEATESHLALLGDGIIIVEALANLEGLPPRFTLCCLPLKLAGRDGSPVRAVALVE